MKRTKGVSALAITASLAMVVGMGGWADQTMAQHPNPMP